MAAGIGLRNYGWLAVLLVTSVLVLLAIGCGMGESVLQDIPVTPSDCAAEPSGNFSNHFLWGYWEGNIPATHDSLEFAPVRGPSIHLNVRKFLEVAPCADCLVLVNLYVNHTDETITASIQLKHPFPGLDKFTGFDVHAVVISDGSRYFPVSDVFVPDYTLGDFTLMNPDGYTRFWNTKDYAPGSGPFPILEYSQGKMASAGEFTGTVNPYIEYGGGERSVFMAGEAITRDMVFKLPAGAIRFGYAVDVSWEPPLVDPPIEINEDFPMSANSIEPIFKAWECGTVYEDPGAPGGAEATVFDYQGVSTLSNAILECPDLWDGSVCSDTFEVTSSTNYGDMVQVAFTFINGKGASAGEYPALLTVADANPDYWLGDVNSMYQMVSIAVQEYIEPELTGKIVFSAPGNGPEPAPNVFVLDVEAMEETQITNYIGVGAIYFEPRINPVGTHVLLDFAPTPYAGHIDVYEIGGTSWTASPPDIYDGTADFHPDGEHILVVSGLDIIHTFDLYSMEYDGSNRTLIATAPDVVRNPRWSPDATRVVMSHGLAYIDPPSTALYIYDVAGNTFTEILAAPGVDEEACWSPVKVDGRDLIVFESSRAHHPDYETDIYIADPDTQEILCHLDTGVYERHPSFSPDGLSFVFSMTDGTDEELYVYYWKTDVLLQLTDDETSDWDPSWSWSG